MAIIWSTELIVTIISNCIFIDSYKIINLQTTYSLAYVCILILSKIKIFLLIKKIKEIFYFVTENRDNLFSIVYLKLFLFTL